jgi:O-antigen ligase
MRYLFFLLFVVLFLPNLGFGGRTVYGTVELSDFIICPYAAVAFMLSLNNKRTQLVDCIVPLMLAFVAWTLIGTALITWRFDYKDQDATIFGLLKLAKFILYGTSGVLTAKALRDPWARQRFDWALLAAGCLLSAGLFATSEASREPALGAALQGFQSQNAISVAVAILGAYLSSIYLFGAGSRRWRQVAPPALLFMVFGAANSHGRGGMVAGLAGLGYAVWRRGINGKVACSIAAIMAAIVASYVLLPALQEEFANTFSPDPTIVAQYHGGGLMGVDDGSRIYTWTHEASKLLNYPVFGTGFFHRGGHSGLWSTGAHNFFLEMFLETGLVGGLLILAILVAMWRQAGAQSVQRGGCGVALKAAIIAAVVGGLGEGYFYGGIGMLSLLAVYAPCGAFVTLPGPCPPAPPFTLQPSADSYLLTSMLVRTRRAGHW